MLVKKIALLSTLGLAIGCTSIPDDAPQVFHEAQSSLEKMDDKDVDELFPKTAERANDTFEKAVDMLEDARDNEPSATESEAIARATEAKNTADGATRLYDKIVGWDKNETSFQDALAVFERAENPVVVKIEETEKVPVSPFAKLQGTEFVSTVAFFETGKAQDPIKNAPELEALTNLLKKDRNYQVALTGYADPRGNSELNHKLAEQRAQFVANHLRDHGINSNQIIIDSVGETKAITTELNNTASLQLDRKVRARLIIQ